MYVDSYAKIFLILYPPLENSTVRIVILDSEVCNAQCLMCDSFHFLIQIFSFLLKQNHGTKKAKKSTYKKQPTSILLKKISLITKTFLATCYKERNLFWNIYRHEKWMMNFTIFERHCASVESLQIIFWSKNDKNLKSLFYI